MSQVRLPPKWCAEATSYAINERIGKPLGITFVAFSDKLLSSTDISPLTLSSIFDLSKTFRVPTGSCSMI